MDDVMSGTQVALGIREPESKELQDIRELITYMDHIQKQYPNVTNKQTPPDSGFREGLILVNTRWGFETAFESITPFSPQWKYQ
jgi:MinD superfamily P-loop ATPase